ncbi:MAG: YkoF family thiamine/hydroxymethylpyrimidine-binding protein [Salibacteraceae bacterium]
MQATVEISMYPLDKDYESYILSFIDHIKSMGGFKVRVNETSTHLFGDFDSIFDALKTGMKKSYSEHDKTVFVLKVLGTDLEGSAEGL